MDITLDTLDSLESVMDGLLDSVDIFQMNDITFNEFDLQNAMIDQPTEVSDSDSGISVSGDKHAFGDFILPPKSNPTALCEQPLRIDPDAILTDVIYRFNPEVPIKPESSENISTVSNKLVTTCQQNRNIIKPTVSLRGPVRLVKLGTSNSIKVQAVVRSGLNSYANDVKCTKINTDMLNPPDLKSGVQVVENVFNKLSESMKPIPPNSKTLTTLPTTALAQPTIGQQEPKATNSHAAPLLTECYPFLEEYDGVNFSDSSLEQHLRKPNLANSSVDLFDVHHRGIGTRDMSFNITSPTSTPTTPLCSFISHASGNGVGELRPMDILLTHNNLERIHKKQERMIKNRHAASLSRLRKKEYLERLEMRYEHLKRENLHLWRQNEEWRLRCDHLERCMDDLQSRLATISQEGTEEQSSPVSGLPSPPSSPGQQRNDVQQQSYWPTNPPNSEATSPSMPPLITGLRVTNITSAAPRVSLSTLANNAVNPSHLKELQPPSSQSTPSFVTNISGAGYSSSRAPPSASPPPAKKPSGVGFYSHSPAIPTRMITPTNSLYCTHATAASGVLTRKKGTGLGGVMAVRPRLIATTSTSLLVIFCLFSMNTVLMPQLPWVGHSGSAVGWSSRNSLAPHLTNAVSAASPGHRVLLSLPDVDQSAVDIDEPDAYLSIDDDGVDDDFITIDCTQPNNQSSLGDGCQSSKREAPSEAKIVLDNSTRTTNSLNSADTPNQVFQNWIKHNRRPIELSRPNEATRKQYLRQFARSRSPKMLNLKASEKQRGLQPFYLDRDSRQNILDKMYFDDLLLEAAQLVSAGKEADGLPRNNSSGNNGTVYLLLSGVNFIIVQTPPTLKPGDNSEGKMHSRQKITFLIPDLSQTFASSEEGSGDRFPTPHHRRYQLLQLDCELVNATRIRSLTQATHAPGHV